MDGQMGKLETKVPMEMKIILKNLPKYQDVEADNVTSQPQHCCY